MKTKTKTDVFRISSGRLVFGDPCYGSNHGTDAQNGPWTAHVVTSDEGGIWGVRVKKVVVHHDDFNPADPKVVVERKGFSVDSGQAGVFDEASYGGDEFYDRCCRATLSKKQYGYLRDGFVTSSGYGDGFYDAEVHKVEGKAVCVELTFIGDEN